MTVSLIRVGWLGQLTRLPTVGGLGHTAVVAVDLSLERNNEGNWGVAIGGTIGGHF